MKSLILVFGLFLAIFAVNRDVWAQDPPTIVTWSCINSSGDLLCHDYAFPGAWEYGHVLVEIGTVCSNYNIPSATAEGEAMCPYPLWMQADAAPDYTEADGGYAFAEGQNFNYSTTELIGGAYEASYCNGSHYGNSTHGTY